MRPQKPNPLEPRRRRLQKKHFQLSALAASVLLAGSGAIAAGETRFDSQAIQLNNKGVALMGQQFTDRAATSFADAFKRDPKMAQAAINEGIALMTLQNLEEAKQAFKATLVLAPDNPQAWYNLGLAQHADNENNAALASFQHAAKYDPHDADSYYYEAVCYGELKQFGKQIEILKQALAIQPLHASS